jgi:hypothetical protein
MKPNTFGSCNEDARNIIKEDSYKNDTTTNWKKKLFDSSDNIKNKCFTNTSEFNEANFKDSECYQLNPEYIRHVGIASNKDINGNIIDVCAPISCQNILTYSNMVNTAAYIRDGVSGKQYVENVVGESSLPTQYDKSIYYLFHTTDSGWNFSEFTNLNYYNYRGMFNKPAECKETPPGPVSVDSSCDSSSTVIFEDSNNYNVGVAYTQEGGANGLSSYDSNFDIKEEVRKPVYNSDGSIKVNESTGETIYEWEEQIKSGYCKETVTFKFPQAVKLTTAGTVMKWGINESKDSDLFGTMRIERECTYPTRTPGARNAQIINNNISLSKISNLQPDIKINYDEAIPSEYSRESLNNSGTLYKLSGSNAVQLDSKQTSLEIDSSSLSLGTESFICSSCGPGSTVTMVANYDLVYNDKLKWYYDKSDNSTKMKTKDSIGDEADSDIKYVFMGYGLPTAFYTPTNIYSQESVSDSYENKYSYGYDIQSEYSKGALYLELNNIGSKISYGEYHFDKLISYPEIDNTYSCGFSIKNNLYDTESGNSDCMVDATCNLPEGLDVVFRTVELVNSEDDLDKAFPGRAGTGRADNRGYNWKILSNEKVAKLLSTTVYDYPPMYHIELTPSKIKKIRQSNKTYRDKKYDPYTYMGTFSGEGFSSFDTYEFRSYDEDASVTYDLSLIDLKDEYIYTTSKYLTDLQDDEYGLDGSCMLSNRLVKHANTQGCYPWSMIYGLNSDDED